MTSMCSPVRLDNPKPNSTPQSLGFVGVEPPPPTVPEEWYTSLFGERYFEVDSIRIPEHVTKEEIERILPFLPQPSSGTLLDMCCGYGRVAIPLANVGYQVHGIDLSAPLLKVARERGSNCRRPPVFSRENIRDFQGGQYAAALFMHTSLGYLPHIGDDVSVLARVRKALQPGGLLLIHQIDPVQNDGEKEGFLSEHYRLSDGTVFEKRSKVDPSGPLWSGQYIYSRESGGSVSFPFRIRLYTPAQLRELLVAAGFEAEGVTVADGWERTSRLGNSVSCFVIGAWKGGSRREGSLSDPACC